MLLLIIICVFFILYACYKENVLKFLILPLISGLLLLANVLIDKYVVYPKLLDALIIPPNIVLMILCSFGFALYVIYSHPDFGILKVSHSRVKSDDIEFFKSGRNYLLYNGLISLIAILIKLTGNIYMSR